MFKKVPKINTPKINIPKINIPKNIDITGLKNFFQQLLKQTQGGPKGSTGSAEGPARPMKFPYTFSAKIAQFPYRFYWKNNWMFRYYPYGALATLPIIYVCHRLANSKGNKAHWKELRRIEEEHVRAKFSSH